MGGVFINPITNPAALGGVTKYHFDLMETFDVNQKFAQKGCGKLRCIFLEWELPVFKYVHDFVFIGQNRVNSFKFCIKQKFSPTFSLHK